jgi:phosphoglycolate phosphatase
MIRTRRAFDPCSIRLVIFDLDGTLIDSRLDLVHSVNAALRHIGRPELPDDVIASYVGDGAPILIQRALGGEAADEALVRKGLEYFLAYYREHKLDHTKVYPGIAEALAAIQHSANGVPRKMAVLSNKPVNPSRAIVEELGLGPFFSHVYGGNSFASKKPGAGCDGRRFSRGHTHRAQCWTVDDRRYLRLRGTHVCGRAS